MENKDMKKLVRAVIESAKKISSGNEVCFVAAYIAFLLYENRRLDRFFLPFKMVQPTNDVPADVIETASNFNIASVWFDLQSIFSEYYREDYEKAIHYIGENYGKTQSESATPKSISNLAIALLDIKSNDCVIDIGCGCGNFLVQANGKRGVKLCGVETDSYARLIALLRLYISGIRNVDRIILADAFKRNLPELDKEDILGRPYRVYKNHHKIFANYPFVSRAKALGNNAAEFAKKLKSLPEFTRDIYSADWLFNALACSMMDSEGVAVAVMGTGSAWKDNDAYVREAFVRANLIEAVIELPPKIFPGIAADLCLVVFKPNVHGVKLIDARDKGISNRRETVLNDVTIYSIKELYENTEPTAVEELKNTNYCLVASRFDSAKNLVAGTSSKKGCIAKPLGDFCQLRRGAMISSEELDASLCSRSAGFRYMVPSNIVNGEIEQKLPFIDPYLLKRRVNTKLYCAKTGNIVMTKNGFPCRLAVVPKDFQVDSSERILANNNLFIISVDGTVADSEYVKLFLESSRGQMLIKNSMVGGAVQSIDQKAFLNIVVPLPPIDKQKAFVKQYSTSQAQVKKARQKLEEALNKASVELDEEMR